jgi:hypothetical protein
MILRFEQAISRIVGQSFGFASERPLGPDLVRGRIGGLVVENEKLRHTASIVQAL